MASTVIAKVTLIGGDFTVAPGGRHTYPDDEAKSLVLRGFAAFAADQPAADKPASDAAAAGEAGEIALADMTKAQLVAFAAENEIEIDERAAKAAIVAAIESALDAAEAEGAA